MPPLFDIKERFKELDNLDRVRHGMNSIVPCVVCHVSCVVCRDVVFVFVGRGVWFKLLPAVVVDLLLDVPLYFIGYHGPPTAGADCASV